MYKIKELLLVSLFVVLTGCGSSNNNSSSSASSPSLVDAEPIKKVAIQVDKLTIDVHKNSYATTTKLLNDVEKMLHSVDSMNKRVINTIDLSMKLVNTLAKPVGITENYKSLFLFFLDYNSTIPAFNISGTLTKKYFLLSSVSPFFLEKKTRKGYFVDTSSLAAVWGKALETANRSKNLYFSIVEIDTNNTIHKVSNALVIKSVDLQKMN